MGRRKGTRVDSRPTFLGRQLTNEKTITIQKVLPKEQGV